MSEHVNTLESAISSSASSIAVKTTVVGGAGLGAPVVIPGMDTNHIIIVNYVDDAIKPFLQSNHIFVFNYAEIMQLVATAWILGQVYTIAKNKIAEFIKKRNQQKLEEKRQFNGPAIMGGNSGSGPGSSSSSSSSAGSGGGGNPREEEQEKQE